MSNITINWTNLCTGVDHATGANAGFWPDNVHILRVDLSNPKISFFTTPTESLNPNGVMTTDLLNEYFNATSIQAQAMFGINANYFDMDARNNAYGLVISEGNTVFPYSNDYPYALVITEQNEASIISLEPGTPYWTAVAGPTMLVQDGANVAPPPQHPDVAARTAIGISVDPAQYLFLITIDGLECSSQTGSYYGATYKDVANWLIAAGAQNAFGLDGGGSTTMAIINTISSEATGKAQALLTNQPHDMESSNAVAERSVAVSFVVVVGS